jgi:flagellar biosynthesis/type III secretory pathway chaperone
LQTQVEQIKSFLSEELAVYGQLLGLSKKKEKTLLEKFSSELMQIVGEEEKLVRRLAEIEQNRQGCVEEITGSRESTMDELCEQISDTTAKSDIWMMGTRLKDVIQEIREINERNQRLLEQALELTQYSISLLTRPAKEVTYSAPGKPRTSAVPGPSLIDRKA